MLPVLFQWTLLILRCAGWWELHCRDLRYGYGVPWWWWVLLRDKGHVAMTHKQAGMEGLTLSYAKCKSSTGSRISLSVSHQFRWCWCPQLGGTRAMSSRPQRQTCADPPACCDRHRLCSALCCGCSSRVAGRSFPVSREWRSWKLFWIHLLPFNGIVNDKLRD